MAPFGSFFFDGDVIFPVPLPAEDDMLVFSGRVQPSHDGALDWFLANTGNGQVPTVGPVTTTDPLTIPIAVARTFTKLTAIIPDHVGNISGVAIPVTLVRYPAGSPLGAPADTALTVNIPVGLAGQTIVSVSTNVSFAVGDAFDVKVHVPIPLAADSAIQITVVLT